MAKKQNNNKKNKEKELSLSELVKLKDELMEELVQLNKMISEKRNALVKRIVYGSKVKLSDNEYEIVGTINGIVQGSSKFKSTDIHTCIVLKELQTGMSILVMPEVLENVVELYDKQQKLI